MDKLKTGFLVVLVGMIVIGVIASYVGADYAFCKDVDPWSLTGYYCDAYTEDGAGYCIGSIECNHWVYYSDILYCIYGEAFYYYGFGC